MNLPDVALTDSILIPYQQLEDYRCWLCDASLDAVAQEGCLGQFVEERRWCNTTGHGRLRQWHKEKQAET